MLSLEDTLSELGDFSTLWFRELYLEIARCSQLPTDTSLPWLLVENCLQSTSTMGLRPLMSVIDIYNDAANHSLYQLKRQTLFDEAEAEGKLCFDQLVYILADQLYVHCTSEALHRLNEPRDGIHDTPGMGSSVKKSSSKGRATLATHPSYEWVADTKRVEVFGESHNLTFLVAQHVHLKIMKELEKWFSKAESSDATSMLELWESLQLIRSSHALLSTLIPVDEFDDMMQEVDAQGLNPDGAEAETSQAIVIPSRIQAYASQILLLDLCQHFSYSVLSCCFQRVPLPSELQSCVPNIYADDVSTENMGLVSRVISSAASQSCQKAEVADFNYRGLFG